MSRKVGLIGTGYWSENHLLAWRRVPGAEVVALCDRDPERLRARARQFDISADGCYTRIEDMLGRAGVEIVDIVTRPETHLDLVRQAAAAGKAILCQKPFAPSLAEAREMVAAAQTAGVRLMVTENWRWLRPIQAVRRVLDSGALGSVRAARYRHRAYATPRMAPDAPATQPYFREMPRFLFYEMGAHWCDAWRFLFGAPRRVWAEIATISPHIVGEDSGVVVLAHDGFLGTLDTSWASRERLPEATAAGQPGAFLEELVIEGEKATLRLSPTGKFGAGTLTTIDNEGRATVLEEAMVYDSVDSLACAQARFVQCLESGEEFPTSGEDNLETLRLVFAIYDSARERRAVEIEHP